MEADEEPRKGRSESEVERLVEVVGEKQEVDSRDKVEHIEKNNQLFVNNDDKRGRERVTTYEEQVFR